MCPGGQKMSGTRHNRGQLGSQAGSQPTSALNSGFETYQLCDWEIYLISIKSLVSLTYKGTIPDKRGMSFNSNRGCFYPTRGKRWLGWPLWCVPCNCLKPGVKTSSSDAGRIATSMPLVHSPHGGWGGQRWRALEGDVRATNQKGSSCPIKGSWSELFSLAAYTQSRYYFQVVPCEL